MIHHCPNCPGTRVIYQIAKRRWWCPKCSLNHERDFFVIPGGQPLVGPLQPIEVIRAKTEERVDAAAGGVPCPA